MVWNSETTDEQLFEQFIRGDETAFEGLVDRYHKQIYVFLVRFTGRPELADDLTQETFIKVHQAAASFDLDKKFRPWVFAIAANKARDMLRSIGRSLHPVSIEAGRTDEDRSLIDIIPSDQEVPEVGLMERERAESVKTAVMTLPENLREVLLLAYYEDMQYKEIAEALGIPLGTVKSRLHKAVNAFGRLWKAKHNERQSAE